MFQANPLLRRVSAPPIPRAVAWAGAYAGDHGDLIDLSQGAPGCPPAPLLLERLAETAGDGRLAGYGPILGEASLRDAYAAHVSQLYGAAIAGGDVAITAGCNEAFFVTVLALAGAGDAVLLPAPWYFNHEMTLSMLGIEARPLPSRAETGFVPDPDEAEVLIDERVRAVVLVTPNNPTGAVYPAHVVARFAALCARRGIWLILDETYRDFRAEDGPPHALLEAPDWGERVVQLYSFSKTYAVPGHRLGAIVAGRGLMCEIAKVLDCVQICAPRPAQAALAAALPELSDWRETERRKILSRAEAFRTAIEAVEGWRADALGGYFAFLRHPFDVRTDADVAEKLAAERGVLCLPGSWFGQEEGRHLRIAFANAPAAALTEAASRLNTFGETLHAAG
jgi:aspartate/methionine/tyrosine aminotransferase